MSGTIDSDSSRIDEQEQQLLKCLPASKKQIAEELDVDQGTVSTYVFRIREKIGQNAISFDYSDSVYRRGWSELPEEWDIEYIEPSGNVEVDELFDVPETTETKKLEVNNEELSVEITVTIDVN